MVRGVDSSQALNNLNMPAHMRAAFIKDHAPEQAVYPENWPSLLVFLDLQGSWTVVAGAMGGLHYIGLRKEARAIAMDDMQIPLADRPRVLADLRILELAWLDERRKFDKERAPQH